MPFTDEILAELQDPAEKEVVQKLPAGVLKALEKRIELAADANNKIAKLKETEEELAKYKTANDSWTAFRKQWDGDEGKDNGIRHKAAKSEEYAKRVAELEAEVAKLKPAADRAAQLANESEEGVIDPAKIEELVLQKSRGEFLSKADVKSIVEEAVKTARGQVSQDIVPPSLSLVEHAMLARTEYGLKNVTSADIAAAAARYGNVPDAIEKGYADVTKAAREQRAAEEKTAAEEKYKADVASARREGAEAARREFETNYINPESSGSVLNVPSLNSPKPEQKGINPKEYDATAGVLAKRAMDHYKQLESEGFKNVN